MRKWIALILCAALLLCGCSGYPDDVRLYLAVPGNYRSCTGTLTGITVDDGVSLQITFDDADTVQVFLGGTPNPAAMPYWFRFEVVGSNQQLLEESGFYDEVEIGSTVTIRASDLIYRDGEYFLLAGLECGGVEYLIFAEGMRNIVSHLDDNKSPF